MARKKATPAEEPEQSGEDAFLEQTGETAEGFAGAEDSGGEMGADSTEAPGEGSVEQPGPESMTPPLEESEAIMPSDETPREYCTSGGGTRGRTARRRAARDRGARRGPAAGW